MTTKNATYGTGAGFAPPSDEHPIFEAMREATRLTLDECKVQWERERALHDACVARTIAELRAEVTALKADLERAVTERLSTLRDGVPGPRGEPGPPGREGRLRTVTEWSGGVHYEGDLIHHGGSLWQCIKDSGRHRHTRIGCVSSAPAVTAARRGFVARGPRMANTARLMSVPWAAARSSRPRTIPVFVQGMDGRLSRCPASAGSRDLLGRVGRRARGDRRVSRRR